jgi:hypothetical protein
MPYIEGQSRRDRLAHERELPVQDAVKITEAEEAMGSLGSQAQRIGHADPQSVPEP